MTLNSNVNKHQLKHGEFKTYVKKLGENGIVKNEIHYFKMLNQNDLADGWKQILPKRNKKSTIHTFSICLSHLPEHLWYKVKRDYNTPNNYKIIRDNICFYNIKPSNNDELIKDLYYNIMSKTPNKQIIKELYDILFEQNVRGWLMCRANRLI